MTINIAIRLLLPAVACSLLAACATSGNVAPPDDRDPADPWEPMNRNIDAFNKTVDDVTLKPVARVYKKVLPSIARRGVSNFYDNLSTPLTALNNFLQGKGRAGASDIGRFLMNSSVGLLGILDVGTEFGLEQHDEDFGQTLAVWGVGDGPYLVIPFLGPSTLRDAFALPLDLLGDPLYHYRNTSVRDKLVVLEVVDLRARLLNAERLLADSSDRYVTIRESYLQNRNYEVYDGNPPVDDSFYDDFEDDFQNEE
jgi:phospholipid-binding lipoprotein MlaA